MRIQLAYTLAKFSHRSQIRKETNDEGKPVRYFEHPRRVALILIDELHIVEADMIVAALLHDGIEDTRDLTPDMIEFHFGSEVRRIVALLSKVPKEGYIDRLGAFADWKTLTVKACDRLDNLRSMDQAGPEFRTKQIKETREVYAPLFNRMVDVSPREHSSNLQFLRTRIFDLCK